MREAAEALREVYNVEVPREVVESWFSTMPRSVRKACANSSVLASFVRLVRSGRIDSCLWALRYVAGAALGDGDRYGRLRVKDWQFAHTYALCLAVLTGDLNAIKVQRTRDGMYYSKKCRLVSFFVRGGLWKVLAYLDKKDEVKHFLSGLMDSEGSIIPLLDRRNYRLRIRISIY